MSNQNRIKAFVYLLTTIACCIEGHSAIREVIADPKIDSAFKHLLSKTDDDKDMSVAISILNAFTTGRINRLSYCHSSSKGRINKTGVHGLSWENTFWRAYSGRNATQKTCNV